VVSAAHCHNLREQTRVLQSLQDICLQQVGVLRKISSTSMGQFTLGAVPVFWWFTNVMCVSKVHVSYCEWLLLLESVTQIGGTIAVFHNRWCLVQSQWVGHVDQSVWWWTTGWTVWGSNQWGPRSLLYNGYRVFPRGKEGPERDADQSPPSSAMVTEE